MQRPQKLSILLVSWITVSLISLVAVLYGIYHYSSFLLTFNLFDKYPNYLQTQYSFFIILFIILTIYCIYLIKVCLNLWHGKNSSRPLTIIAIFNLFSIPIGTSLAIATLIILNSSEVKSYLNKK